jgi:hypothetical protein
MEPLEIFMDQLNRMDGKIDSIQEKVSDLKMEQASQKVILVDQSERIQSLEGKVDQIANRENWFVSVIRQNGRLFVVGMVLVVLLVLSGILASFGVIVPIDSLFSLLKGG